MEGRNSLWMEQRWLRYLLYLSPLSAQLLSMVCTRSLVRRKIRIVITCQKTYHKKLTYILLSNFCNEMKTLEHILLQCPRLNGFFEQHLALRSSLCTLKFWMPFLLRRKTGRGCPVGRVLSSGPEGPNSRLTWRETAMYANGTWCM